MSRILIIYLKPLQCYWSGFYRAKGLFGLFRGNGLDLFNLLGRLDAGGANQHFVAIHAANLKIHILAALGRDVRVAAADASHESALAIGALSGHTSF